MKDETKYVIRNAEDLFSGKLHQGREKYMKITLEAVGYEPVSAG
jgi:hypothetical protein